MHKLKMCFFVPYYPLIRGGAEYQARIIAEHICKDGHQVVYISVGHDKEKVIETDGFKVHLLRVTTSKIDKVLLYRKLMKKVATIVKKEAPDLVYQRILNTFSYRLSNVAKDLGIPFILHIADNYSVDFQNTLKHILKAQLFKGILKNDTRIICQTQYQYEKIKRFGDLPKIIIPNMHPILRENIGKKKKDTIVWIGNARPVKRLELFLDLAELYEQDDFSFNVIGRLPNNPYGKNLLTRIQNIKNVVYHGSRTNSYINKFLVDAGLLVNTSVSEGFSNTFIQAWMTGTPVLSLNSDPDGTITKHGMGVFCKGNYGLMPKKLEEITGSGKYYDLCENILAISNRRFSTTANMAVFYDVLRNSFYAQ